MQGTGGASLRKLYAKAHTLKAVSNDNYALWFVPPDEDCLILFVNGATSSRILAVYRAQDHAVIELENTVIWNPNPILVWETDHLTLVTPSGGAVTSLRGTSIMALSLA